MTAPLGSTPVVISDRVPEDQIVTTEGPVFWASPLTVFRLTYPDPVTRLGHLSEWVGQEIARRYERDGVRS